MSIDLMYIVSSDEFKNVTFTQTKDISGFNEMSILFVILIK
jgi:hypothetical protein